MDNSKKEEFIKEYNELCNKFGLTLVALPSFIRRDDGTYSTVIQFSVEVLPKANG
jgi:hypothetical protein